MEFFYKNILARYCYFFQIEKHLPFFVFTDIYEIKKIYVPLDFYLTLLCLSGYIIST